MKFKTEQRLIAITAVVGVFLLYASPIGCAALRNTATQTMDIPRTPVVVADEDLAVPDVLANQQSGQGNLSSQIDSSGWTGIEYNTAVPLGQVALMLSQVGLMGLMLYLSHRREMWRIKLALAKQQQGHMV